MTDQGPQERTGSDVVRMRAWVHGYVQGVGFRWWTRARALELGLVGSAANQRDGRVLITAEGERTACQALLDQIDAGKSPGQVDTVVTDWEPPRGDLTGFVER
ncbi:UNVERIFIED_CONTAM: acylphosphatase [Williamsia faeni]